MCCGGAANVLEENAAAVTEKQKRMVYKKLDEPPMAVRMAGRQPFLLHMEFFNALQYGSAYCREVGCEVQN
jgi:hypothetical protein